MSLNLSDTRDKHIPPIAFYTRHAFADQVRVSQMGISPLLTKSEACLRINGIEGPRTDGGEVGLKCSKLCDEMVRVEV